MSVGDVGNLREEAVKEREAGGLREGGRWGKLSLLRK